MTAKKPGPHHDEEWLREKYWDEGLSQKEIGELAGVTQGAIGDRMAVEGIPTRSKKPNENEEHAAYTADRKYRDEEWLREMYCERELTAEQIAERVEEDVHHSTVLKWMDEYEIPRREPSVRAGKKHPDYVPTEELLDDLVAGYLFLGHWPSTYEYNKFSSHGAITLLKRWDTWEGALDAAREHYAETHEEWDEVIASGGRRP